MLLNYLTATNKNTTIYFAWCAIASAKAKIYYTNIVNNNSK